MQLQHLGSDGKFIAYGSMRPWHLSNALAAKIAKAHEKCTMYARAAAVTCPVRCDIGIETFADEELGLLAEEIRKRNQERSMNVPDPDVWLARSRMLLDATILLGAKYKDYLFDRGMPQHKWMPESSVLNGQPRMRNNESKDDKNGKC